MWSVVANEDRLITTPRSEEAWLPGYQSLFQILKRSLSLTGKHKRSEDQTITEEESVKKKLKTETPISTDCPLPAFDPSNPVGTTLVCFYSPCHLCCVATFVFIIFLHIFSHHLIIWWWSAARTVHLHVCVCACVCVRPQVWSSWSQRQVSSVRCVTGSSAEPKRQRSTTAKPSNTTITYR